MDCWLLKSAVLAVTNNITFLVSFKLSTQPLSHAKLVTLIVGDTTFPRGSNIPDCITTVESAIEDSTLKLLGL